MRLSVPLALGVALLVGCASDNPAGPSAAAGGVWRLTSLERADGSRVPIDDPDRYTLELGEEGRLSVRADCNVCSGAYRLEGEALEVEPLACTEVACPPESLEQDYLTMLAGSRSFELRDGALTIRSTGGVLRFQR